MVRNKEGPWSGVDRSLLEDPHIYVAWKARGNFHTFHQGLLSALKVRMWLSQHYLFFVVPCICLHFFQGHLVGYHKQPIYLVALLCVR